MNMRIAELVSENVKRLHLVELEFDPEQGLFIVGGRNRQGKSSVLDSIMYVLGGGSTLPEQPIRNGQKKAEITIIIEGRDDNIEMPLTVTRKFTSKGSSLVVTSGEGEILKSPQKILGPLFSKFSFDPLEFSEQKPKRQAEMLRELVGIDFSELDKLHDTGYQSRTEANREIKELTAKIAGHGVYKDLPNEEVSVAKLLSTLNRRQAVNRSNKKIRDDEREADEEVARLQKEHEKLTQKLHEAQKKHDELTDRRIDLVDADEDEIREKMASADDVNAKVRSHKERLEAESERDDLEELSKTLTEGLEQIAEQKAQMLADADWPVDGLGFDDEGVTLNGLPFDQASSAEQLRTSIAIGFESNPKLPISLIREGSLLDDDHLAIVDEMAKKYGGQIIMERVGEGEECSVIIEDGYVKEEEEEEN